MHPTTPTLPCRMLSICAIAAYLSLERFHANPSARSLHLLRSFLAAVFSSGRSLRGLYAVHTHAHTPTPRAPCARARPTLAHLRLPCLISSPSRRTLVLLSQIFPSSFCFLNSFPQFLHLSLSRTVVTRPRDAWARGWTPLDPPSPSPPSAACARSPTVE